MRIEDMDRIYALSLEVHPDYFEDSHVLEERFSLYNQGSMVLWAGHKIAGYVLSHPWYEGKVPQLNKPLIALPEKTSSYYLHDLALLPDVRGKGQGDAAVKLLCKHAFSKQFQSINLVCVAGSERFWEKMGFQASTQTAPDGLASYGENALFMQRLLAQG